MEDWRVNRVDELTLRDRMEHGAFGPVAFDHNELHQVENRTAVDPAVYTWGVNGNISTRTGGPYGDAVFAHDWRDRLASVEQGGHGGYDPFVAYEDAEVFQVLLFCGQHRGG